MKKILLTGALGQIGSELTAALQQKYGTDNVVATDIRYSEGAFGEGAVFETLDIMDGQKLLDIVKKHKIDTIIHLAAMLSANAEKHPQRAWDINMNGLMNSLEVAREENCKFFTPSSIGAFGPSTIKNNTPQVTVQRPTSIYGVSKVASELLCDYYFTKFGVDTRGLRFPGLISYLTPPGGGTTDYAVDIYYQAVKKKSYTSFLDRGTYLDMMYMPDAIGATMRLLEAESGDLIHRNAYNVTAMSVDPESVASSIRKHIPEFELSYDVDPIRQAIAESWPDHIDPTAAKEEFGFNPQYDLDRMTADMLKQVKPN
ncbi:NAD-dependent epimerase/dehydratase family protein [Geomicrobium sp. JCM 19039]|uniref:NAD-dependent epimerase/dehydratase family protein n=1 Tax=Geomicrobium sp. JCM 19039 TaxID=1460636 RepID=UPI00045F493B|nr:NAD-dependent epimerase/dehydratase family protein [Geomicrobium sp. JCM 19039]GAK13402.1 L-threonine 3-dehydrogenase [Geomicrobium sp. JCM 19039]